MLTSTETLASLLAAGLLTELSYMTAEEAERALALEAYLLECDASDIDSFVQFAALFRAGR